MQHDFILLDRSGSMSSQWSEALGSVNAYVRKLADERVDTGVTLACFDAHAGECSFDVIRDRITPSTWRVVSADDASPRGGTPLNDAIGKLVARAKEGWYNKDTGKSEQYDKVAIIIMTDGQENASKELSIPQAKVLLDECRARGWQVIFLGASYDNVRMAFSYGNMPSHTHQSVPSVNLAATMDFLGATRSLYGATGQVMEASEDKKAALTGRTIGNTTGGPPHTHGLNVDQKVPTP